MQIFKKEYDGESLYDLGRDMFEMQIVASIPVDLHGMPLGKFIVSVEWEECDE